MKYKITDSSGQTIYINDLTINELPEGATPLTDEEWENRLIKTDTTAEKKERKKNSLILSRKSYLLSTDWYISREIDQANSYPEEIKNKRILAREEINQIEACTTLTALNQFSEVFE